MKRRLLRPALTVWTVLLVAQCGSIFAQTSPVTRFVLGKLRNYFRDSLHIDLEASGATVDLVRGSLTLNNVVLRSTDAPDLPAMFQAKTVYMNVGLVKLAKGSLEIENARIDSPSIRYVAERNGRNNLPRPPPSSSSTKILILHGEAVNGSLQVDDARQDIHVTFPGWHAQVQGNPVTLAHDFGFRAQRAAIVNYQGRAIPVDRLDVDGAVQKSSLQLHSARIVSADSSLVLSGAINDLSSPVLDVRINPELDLKGVSLVAGLKQQLAGALSGTVSINGPMNAIRFQAQLRGSKVTIPGYERSDFTAEARAEWDGAAERLAVSSFAIHSKPGSFTGNANLALETGESRVHANVSDFDLTFLSRQLSSSFEIASRATGNVSVQWNGPLTPSALSGKAQVKLIPTRRTPRRNIMPVAAAIDATFRGNRIEAILQSLEAVSARISGRAVIQSLKTIQGDFRGNTPNVEATLAQLSDFLGSPDRTVVGTRFAGGVAFTARASGDIQRPKLVTSLEGPAMEVGRLKDVGIKANADYSGSRITFETSIQLPRKQMMIARGNVSLAGPQPVFNIDAIADQISVPALAALLNSPTPAAGTLQASAHIAGPLKDLAGTASITGSGLVIDQEPMGNLAAELRLSGKVIETTRFVLVKNPQNPSTDYLTGKVAYNLQSGQYSFQADGKDLAFDHRVQPNGTPVSGTVNLAASGTGTLSNPSINLNLDATDIRVRDRSVGTINVTAALSDQRITLQANAPKLGVKSNAHLMIRSPYPADARLEFAKTDLALLALPNLEGNIDATLAGSGNLNNLASAQATAHIQTLRLSSNNQHVQNEGVIEARYQGGSLEISPANIVAGNSTFQIAGTVPLVQQAPAGRLTAKGRLDLNQIVNLVSLPSGYSAAGRLNLDLLLAGTLRQLDASGSLTIADGSLRAPQAPAPVSNISASANLQDGNLVLQQADAQWASAKIALSGVLPLGLLPIGRMPIEFRRSAAPARFALTVSDLKVESTGAAPQNVSGVISVSATGQANRLDVNAVSAQAEFDQLNLKVSDFALNQIGRSTIFLRDGTVSIGRLMMQGPETTLQAAGSAALTGNGPLDLRITGKANAAVLGMLTQQVKASGPVQLQLGLSGTRDAPDFAGFVQVNDGQASLSDPKISATNLNVRLDLSRNRMAISRFSGSLNGGPVTAAGSITYSGGALNNVDISAKLQDVFLDYPQGLNSTLSGQVTARSSGSSIVVGGALDVLQGSYRQPIDFAGQLLNYLRSEQVTTVGPQVSPLLSRVRFDLGLRTDTALLVNNNVAKLAADLNVKLVGTFYQPSVVGRVYLEEGGQIYLNERTYVIDHGIINLTNQSHIEPNLNIEAQTTAAGYEITLRLNGTPQKMTTDLSADPPLAQPDIVSVLLTGRTTHSDQPGSQMQMAQTQALSLIAGQAGQEVTRAAHALGLGNLRVQPELIAPESDPGARLTVGEDITKDLSLNYSWNLLNSGDQIWVAQYNVTRRFTTEAIKQPDNSYRLGFNHDVRFGGLPGQDRRTRIVPQKKVGAVKFQGGPLFPDKALQDKLGVGPGDKFDFIKLQKGMDRLQDFYAEKRRLEAQIRFDRQNEDDTVDLDFRINAGPVVDFVFEGAPLSKGVKNKVEEAWRNGVFDRERLDDAVAEIRRPLVQKGYLQSNVGYDVEEGVARKLVRFRVAEGPRFTHVGIVFPGASGIPASELQEQLDNAKLNLDVYADPQKVVNLLNHYYRQRGYLQASIGQPDQRLDARTGTGKIVIPVHEGPLFTIGKLTFNGNSAFSSDQLWSLIPISSGSGYKPSLIADSMNTLSQYYHTHGYEDVVVTFRIVEDTNAALANIAFAIQEGRQSIVRDIVISGNNQTGDSFVRKQLTFKPGDVLDYDKISQTRQRLYETGVYSVADFEPEDLGTSLEGPNTKDVRIRISLREVQPYRMQYGAYYDTDRGPGGILDVSNRNLFGHAADLGARVRYDSDLKEGRLYFSQPLVHRLYLKTDASAFVRRETRPGFSANWIGFSLFQEKRLHRQWLLDYGYRYDHVRWNGTPPDPTLYVANVPVASLAATLTQDTRDSLLDATRGSFNSHAFEFGPRWLGSEIGFVRYFGQYFRYVPLQKTVRDEHGQLVRPNLIYAGAVRIGLSKAFGGQDIITPERFFAGGGTTLRGFRQDLLGPLGSDGKPLGGEAMLLINNEIRFPIIGILQGVGFVDVGNVYGRLSDFDPGRLRKSAGPGLRIRTKFMLLRFDYGFKLDRKAGERGSAFFFSIGQAF